MSTWTALDSDGTKIGTAEDYEAAAALIADRRKVERIEQQEDALRRLYWALETATRAAYAAEDFWEVAMLARRCGTLAAEIEMLRDAL